MKDSNISKSYAMALYQLGKEKNIDTADELIRLNEAVNVSNDLERVLFMELFTVDEKLSVIATVMEKLNLSKPVRNFVLFLIREKRIRLFPVIFKDLVVLDDHEKGFLRGTLEGTESVPEENDVQKIKSYLKEKLEQEIKLDYKQNPQVVAGLRATVGDFQVDASCKYQLKRFKEHILNG